MHNYLIVLFSSVKFYYYFYNIILSNSKRIYTNNFFKNTILLNKSLNLNFYLDKYWILNNRYSWYYLGFSSLLFTFKTKGFFYKYLKDQFYFNKINSLFDNFMVSSDSLKNSKKSWKNKNILFFINIFDWSLFFKKNLNKSKFLFLFASCHPLQDLSFKYLKKYDFDYYNNDEVEFNLDISDNTDLNYNTNFLLSEFFFFNNNLQYDLDIDNSFFLFFFIKCYAISGLFNFNKSYFKHITFLSFYYLVFYPYYFINNTFFLYKNSEDRFTSTTYFDMHSYPIEDSIVLLGLNLNYIFLKKYNLNFHQFLVFLFFFNLL